MKLDIVRDAFPLAEPFVISGRGADRPFTRGEAQVLTVTLDRDGVTGRGECTPYARYGESLDSVTEEIRAAEPLLRQGLDRDGLLAVLRPGAARNALDCALWDWQAKAAGRRVWDLAGLPPPLPVQTCFTLSLADPVQMRRKAAENAWRPILKLKLGGPGDLDRLRAVRAGAPGARIVVDANEGWTAATWVHLAPQLTMLGVQLVEQPLPASDDSALASQPRPLPVCADESCHTSASLPALAERYDMVNIKLDKAGGLTEALRLRAAARAQGFRIMVGCMMGTSLAIAPALILAQSADLIDLDPPLLLARDRPHALRIDGSRLHPPDPELWG